MYRCIARLRIPDRHNHSIKFRDLGGHSLGHLTWNQDCKICFSAPGAKQFYIATVSTAFRDMTSFSETLLKDYARYTVALLVYYQVGGRVPDCRYNYQCKDLVTPVQPASQLLWTQQFLTSRITFLSFSIPSIHSSTMPLSVQMENQGHKLQILAF